MRYYTGTSGLLLPYRNKSFYPEALQQKSRLHVYSLLFNSIEINSTFYKIPQPKTLLKWASEVTPAFRFTFKLWKGITHSPGLNFAPDDVARFMQAIHQVGSQKGCLLLQLPPSLTLAAHRALDKLLDTITRYDNDRSWRVCVEFRHPSWYCAPVYKLLDDHQAGIVCHDKNKSGLNLEETAAPYVYLRLHGPDGNYKGSYDRHVLEEYALYVRDWMEAGKEAYVYFNNTMGAAIENLRYLRTVISGLPGNYGAPDEATG